MTPDEILRAVVSARIAALTDLLAIAQLHGQAASSEADRVSRAMPV